MMPIIDVSTLFTSLWKKSGERARVATDTTLSPLPNGPALPLLLLVFFLGLPIGLRPNLIHLNYLGPFSQ